MRLDDLLESVRFPWNHRKGAAFADAKPVSLGSGGLTLADFATLPNANVAELLASASKKKIEEFVTLAAERVNELLASHAHEAKSQTRENDVAMDYIETVCSVIQDLLSPNMKSVGNNTAILNILSPLHDALFEMSPESSPAVTKAQNAICKACETYFTQDRPDKEHVVPQMLTYLLILCSSPAVKAVDVKRLWSVRHALQALDLDDPSSDWFRATLLRLYVHPVILRASEGRRLLSFLFSLSPSLVDAIHAVIKGQLPNCRPSLLEYYAEVYFRAWRDISSGASSSSSSSSSSGAGAAATDAQVLSRIEYGCIQDFIDAAVHSRQPHVVKAVQAVLRLGFHKSKLQYRPVDEMLTRLYAPILWRSLTAANPAVRRNAVALFIDAFPLANPEGSVQETEALLQKQFDQLLSLLDDVDVAVRTRAVEGICHVLHGWWELLPQTIAKNLLLRLVNELAFDASAVAVRAAVLEGLAHVLEMPLSHGALKLLLPKLAPLLHDRAERVQLAMLTLLISVKRLRTIRFFDIVTVEDLLLRLQTSSTPVAVRIAELLLNSYFPVNKPPSEQLVRALTLLKKDPVAGKVFYSLVHTLTPGSAVLKMVCVFYKFMVQHASQLLSTGVVSAPAVSQVNSAKKQRAQVQSQPNAKKKNSKRRGDGDDNEEEEEGEGAGGNGEAGDDGDGNMPMNENNVNVTTELACSVLVTMATMWNSVHEYRREVALHEYMESVFKDGGLQTLLLVYGSNEIANAAILAMAAKLPSRCLPQLAEQGIARLIALPVDAPPTMFTPLVECLFSWDKVDTVLDHVYIGACAGLGLDTSSSTSSSSSSSTSSAAAAGGKKGKGVRATSSSSSSSSSSSFVSSPNRMNPVLAVRLFSSMMENTRTRSTLLASPTFSVVEAALAKSMATVAEQFSPEKLSIPLADDDGAQTDSEHYAGGATAAAATGCNARAELLVASVTAHVRGLMHQLARAKAQRDDVLEGNVPESDDDDDEGANNAEAGGRGGQSSEVRRASKHAALVQEAEVLATQAMNGLESVYASFSTYVLPHTMFTESTASSSTSTAAADAAASGTKKARKGVSAEGSSSSTSSSSSHLHYSKQLLAQDLLYSLSKLASEVATLTMVTASFPTPYIADWMQVIQTQLTSSPSPFSSSSSSSSSSSAVAAAAPSVFLMTQLFPVLSKFTFQLATNINAGGVTSPLSTSTSTSTSSSPLASKPTFAQVLSVLNHLLHIAIAMPGSSANPLFRETLLEIMRVVSPRKENVVAVTAALLEAVVDEIGVDVVGVPLPELKTKSRSGDDDESEEEEEEEEEEGENSDGSGYDAVSRRGARQRLSPSSSSSRSSSVYSLPELADFLLLVVAKSPASALGVAEAVSVVLQNFATSPSSSSSSSSSSLSLTRGQKAWAVMHSLRVLVNKATELIRSAKHRSKCLTGVHDAAIATAAFVDNSASSSSSSSTSTSTSARVTVDAVAAANAFVTSLQQFVTSASKAAAG